jgi:phosphonatase-like hydrolase
MQSTFQLVVFDMAGTTIQDNSNVAEAFMYAMQKHGYPISNEQANKVMGYKKMVAINDLLDSNYPGIINENENLINEIHDTFIETMIDFYEHAKEILPMESAESIFKWLQDNDIKVALNTGFSKLITDTILERVGWHDNSLIDFIISSDEVESGRPSADMIQAIMKATGITDTATVIKVGDTEVDIAEGRTAGCGLVVSVTTGSFTRSELQSHQPDVIIDDLKELPSLIKPVAVAN